MSGHHKNDYYGGRFLTILILLAFILSSFIIFCPLYAGIPDSSENTVEIAVMLPLSDQSQNFGPEYKRGIDLAIDELNAGGKVAYKVTYYDTEGNESKMKDDMKKIYESGASVMIGPVSSRDVLAVAPLAEKYNIVMISPGASSDALSSFRNVYRMLPSDKYLGSGIANMISENFPGGRVVILYNDNIYGNGLKDAFENEMIHHMDQETENIIGHDDSGIILIADLEKIRDTYQESSYAMPDSINEENDANAENKANDKNDQVPENMSDDGFYEYLSGEFSESFSDTLENPVYIGNFYPIVEVKISDEEETVKKLSGINASCIYFISDGPLQFENFMTLFEKAGIQSFIITTDNSIGMNFSAFSENPDASKYADGTIAFVPAKKVTTTPYITSYEQKFGKYESASDSMYSYDAMMLIDEVVRSEGSDPESIKYGLDNIRYLGVSGAIVFRDNNSRYPAYDVMKMENGSWVNMDWKELFDRNYTATKGDSRTVETEN